MCLDVSCSHSGTTFEDREKWISHLALDHEMEPKWDSIECPFCKHVTGSGKSAVTNHFAEHLEEISLSALPVQVYSNEASEDGSQLGGTDDDSKNPQESSHPNAKGKGKLTSIADNDSINERWNIPCRILFVYNLPRKVSEEGLQATFSKQQGFKRVFFKAAQNFPLSFIEFDSTSSAMKAVLDLHGKPQTLLNNGKDGILLSFASNFLSHISELRSRDDWLDIWPEFPASENPSRPPGWALISQELTHQNYYYNSETNATSWQKPLFNPAYNPPTSQPPIHQEWIPFFEHGYQQWLYVNRETGLIQREAPVVNPVYRPPPNKPPVPPGWMPLYDHHLYQRWYYVNQETGQTQWEAPGITQVDHEGAAEKSAPEATEQVDLAEEGQAAVTSKKEEDLITASVTQKEEGDGLLRKDQQTLRISTTKTGGELSVQEEQRAAQEFMRVQREILNALRDKIQALRDEIQALREKNTS